MARKIHSRIRIKGQLKVMRSLHVGGIHSDSTQVDLPLAVNGQGKVYIPGTSLAGALRAYMHKAHNEQEMKQVWGYQEGDKGQASYLIIEDAVVTLPSGHPMKPQDMEIRDGVGIDRNRGTAAKGFKFNRAIIPRNSTLPLNLTLEVKDEASPTQQQEQLDNMLAALSQGLIRLGGAKSRGLGCIKLEKDCQGQIQTLSNCEGLLELLKQKAGDPNEDKLPAWKTIPKEVANAPTQLKLRIEWEPVGPVMVKSEQSGVAVDILPLMSRFDDQHLGFVLPGSAIKGTLRSQAERILRTVLQRPLPPENDFARQIQLPLAAHLFGTAAQSDKPDDKPAYPTWASALFIEDCFSQLQYKQNDWELIPSAIQKLPNREKPNDPEEQEKLIKEKEKLIKNRLHNLQKHQSLAQHEPVIQQNASLKPEIQQAFHVAIDRWTGGAADQFLYTAIEPFNIDWEPIEIGLKLGRLDKKEYGPAIALLLVLLRDFANQRIPLGYGVNRGYGTVKLKKATFQLQGKERWPENLQVLDGAAITKTDLSQLDDELRSHLTTEWQQWINQHASTTQQEVA